MSGYTVEIRVGIFTSDNVLHTWLHITKPDGSVEAWGFHPKEDSFGNIIYGQGDVQPESTTKQYTSSSGQLPISQGQYDSLTGNIATQDATPPNYSLVAIPGGQQCSMWAVKQLEDVGLIPEAISPDITPEFIPFLDALIWNPITQTVGFSLNKGSQVLAAAVGSTGAAITSYAPALIDALSLVQAARSGQPLPVVASGLRAMNDLTSIRVPNNPGDPGGATKLQPTHAGLNGATHVAGGILSLLATRLDDRSVIGANRDGVTSYEDTELIISAAGLMANDTLAGLSGQNLSITGVSGFTHGSGFMDGNGFVHYTPDANYAGAANDGMWRIAA